MLFILDKKLEVIDTLSNKGETSSITPYFEDEYKQYLATGAETFSFQTLANTKESQHLTVGNYVAFMFEKQYKLFHITQIEEEHTEYFVKSVYCEMAGIELINDVVRPANILSASLSKFLDNILTESNWSVGILDIGVSGVYDIDIKDYTNVYSALQEYVCGTYGGEISLTVDIKGGRVVGKYVNVYSKRGKENGFRFAYSSNISSITRTVDSSELATALIGIGSNGLTFKEVEASDKPLNQDFLADEEAYKIWNQNGSHIIGVEKFETESAHELLKLTREKLAERRNPKVKYELKTELLAQSEVQIGDTVLVVDHEFNPPIYLEARINELTTSFTDPNKNECVLANFKELNSNITDEMRQIASQLEGYVDSQFPIGGDKIQDGAIDGDKLHNGQIITGTHLFANSITADKIKADQIEAGHIKADSIETKHLSASSIEAHHIKSEQIETNHLKAEIIEAGHIKADQIEANHIKTDSIESKHIQAGSIEAEHIKSGSITGDHIIGGSITGGHIVGGTITGGLIHGDTITGDHIIGGSITGDHIAGDTITGNHIQSGSITAGSGIIAEGAIGSAQISDLDAGKITAGKIDTSKIEIAGANGHLRLKGNRMQVFDGLGTQAKERVSVGDVNGDGTVFGLRVRGKDGQTILLDENGVTEQGITDGSITNDKISDQAEIDGAKLNINSVVSHINKDGTEVIKGTKIEVDGTNLTAKLSDMTIKQNEDSSRITQNSSSIKANENAIKLKVDEQIYTTDKADMTQKLEKNTADISIMKNEISLKVEQTDIETALDGLQIGGTNLVPNTGFSDGTTGWGYWNGATGMTIIENGRVSGVNGARITLADRNGSGYRTPMAEIVGGEDYVVSFWIKASANCTAGDLLKFINSEGAESNPISMKTIKLTADTWTKYEFAFTAPITAVKMYGTPRVDPSVGAIHLFLSEYQIEEGTKATTWSPSPSELFADTNSKINTAKAEIKLTTDKITQDVTQLSTTVEKKADGSTVTELSKKVGTLEVGVEGITGTVSDLQSTTKKHTDDISGISTEVSTVKSNVATLNVDVNGISQRVTSTESSVEKVTDKVDNMKIGGRNLLPKNSLQLANSATGTFDEETNTWTLTATTGSTTWGRGISLKTQHSIVIPYGGGAVYSFEIKVPRQINWNIDINNAPVTGTTWGGNDNDNSSKRSTSPKTITKVNEWVKCWAYIENTATANTGKLDIKDVNTLIGVVTTNETEDVVFYIKNVKVELGNQATDWSPCPDDVDSKFDDVYDHVSDKVVEVTKSYESAIEVAKDSITLEVAETYATTDELGKSETRLSSQIEQTAKDINMSFTTTSNQISGNLEEFKNEVNSYIKFNADGMELGKTDSKFKAKLTNTKLAFTESDSEVAYISNKKMYITDAEVTNQLTLGKFAFVPRSNGNTSLKWIG